MLAVPSWLGQAGGVSSRRWDSLSPRARHLIIGGAAVEGALKAAALSDLVRRREDQVHGAKGRWALALVLVNSGGALPIYYFARGRR